MNPVGGSLDRIKLFLFMENNEVSLQQLLDSSSKEIFEKSKYKPKKIMSDKNKSEIKIV
jgi:hypothetical protein